MATLRERPAGPEYERGTFTSKPQGRRKKELALFLAIVTLHTPEGGKHVTVHAIGPFDLAQSPLMNLHHLHAIGDTRIIDQEGHIVPDREAIFRLGPREAHRLFIE